MSFGHFKTAIAPTLGCVRGISSLSMKALGEVFLILLCFHISRYCIRRYVNPKLGCWIEKGPNPDLRKAKIVFSPINILFHFRDLFWVKIAFVRLQSLTLCLDLGEERREETKGEKSRIH